MVHKKEVQKFGKKKSWVQTEEVKSGVKKGVIKVGQKCGINSVTTGGGIEYRP